MSVALDRQIWSDNYLKIKRPRLRSPQRSPSTQGSKYLSEVKLWRTADSSALNQGHATNDLKTQSEESHVHTDKTLYSTDLRPGDVVVTLPRFSPTIYDFSSNAYDQRKERGILVPKLEDMEHSIKTSGPLIRAVDWKIEEDEYLPPFDYHQEITEWDVTSDSGVSEDYSSPISDTTIGQTQWEMIIEVPDSHEQQIGYKRYLDRITPSVTLEKKRTFEEYDWVRTSEGLQRRKRTGMAVKPLPLPVDDSKKVPEKMVSFVAPKPVPEEEKYTEETWTVYHTVPISAVEEFDGPLTNARRSGMEYHTDVKALEHETQAYHQEDSRDSFIDQRRLPDHYTYNYEDPMKQRQLIDIHQSRLRERAQTKMEESHVTKSVHHQARINPKTWEFPVDAVRQNVHIEEDDDEVTGLSRGFEGVGGAADFTESFNTVTEHVLIDIENGVATVDVTIEYEHYAPYDLEVDLWKRNRVTVYRKIEIDFEASETTRRWFERILEDNLPDIDWSVNKSKSYRLRGTEAYKIYNALMAIGEEEERKKEEMSGARIDDKNAYFLDSSVPQHLAAGFDQHLQSDVYY